MAGFSVNIGANATLFTKTLGELGRQLKAFQSGLQAATSPESIGRLNRAIETTKQRIDSLKGFTGTGFQNIAGGANAASLALTNVGRVAQDLPFGFIGIQNNLNPLLESFQRLKAETGSSQLALKALGNSLIGAGGIGLALSVVSSAFVIWQNGIAGFNKKTKEAKEAADELKKVIRDLEVVRGEAAASTQGQIAVVNALTVAVLDETRSQKERKNALDQLKETNKSYFSDLTLEATQLATLKTRVEEYTKALIQQAIVKGYEEDIVAVTKAQVKADKDVAAARIEVADATKALNAANREALSSIGGREGVSRTREQAKAQEVLLTATEKLRTANENATKLQEQELILTNLINKAVLDGLKLKSLSSGQGNSDKEDPVLKSLKKELAGYQKQLETTNKLREAGLLPLFRENDALELQLKILNTLNAIDAREVKIKAKPSLEIDPVLNELEITKSYKEFGERSKHRPIKIPLYIAPEVKIDVGANAGGSIEAGAFDAVIKDVMKTAGLKIEASGLALMASLRESIKQTVQEGAGEMVTGLGEAFGEALASGDFGGGLRKAGQNILSVIGNVMQQIGKQVIAAAIKIKLLKETLEKWAIANPGLAILAGAGLVAAGAALRNLKFDGPKFATGGIVTGPVIGQVGEMHRPEVILPLDRLPQMLAQYNNGSGGGGYQLIPIINNDGLYLAVKKGERSVGRKF